MVHNIIWVTALFFINFQDGETFVSVRMFAVCDSPIAGAADCAQFDGYGLLGGIHV